MTRSIVRRMTLPAPSHLIDDRPRVVSASIDEAKHLVQTQAQISETIDGIRGAVAQHTGEVSLAGSDEELEGFTVEPAMLEDARRNYARPSGHLTRRLLKHRRDARAVVGSAVELRLARRPFALVACKVAAVRRPGKVLDVIVEQGPDRGLVLRVELGLAFPWDVLVRAL